MVDDGVVGIFVMCDGKFLFFYIIALLPFIFGREVVRGVSLMPFEMHRLARMIIFRQAIGIKCKDSGARNPKITMRREI